MGMSLRHWINLIESVTPDRLDESAYPVDALDAEPDDILDDVIEWKELTGETPPGPEAVRREIVAAQRELRHHVRPDGRVAIFRAIVEPTPGWIDGLEPGGKLGTDWSFDPLGAFAYNGRGGNRTVIFAASVAAEDVNWLACIAMLSSGEAEIRLRRGTEIVIDEVRVGADRGTANWNRAQVARPDLAGQIFVA